MALSIVLLLALCSCIGAKISPDERLQLQQEIIAEIMDAYQSRIKRTIPDSPELPITEKHPENDEFQLSGSPSDYFAQFRDISHIDTVIPGLHYPIHMDIPDTSFTCSNKPFIPGFYADVESACQVFHVCWPHMRESFLCPIGATFNQEILACDHWYNSKCSPSQHDYNVNAVLKKYSTNGDKDSFGSVIQSVADHLRSQSIQESVDLQYVVNLLPVKARVTAYPDTRDTSNLKAEPRLGMLKPKKFTQVKREKIVTPKYFLAIGKILKQLSADIEASPKYSLIVMKLMNNLVPNILANTSPFKPDFGTIAINPEEKFEITIILLMAKIVVIASEILGL